MPALKHPKIEGESETDRRKRLRREARKRHLQDPTSLKRIRQQERKQNERMIARRKALIIDIRRDLTEATLEERPVLIDALLKLAEVSPRFRDALSTYALDNFIAAHLEDD